MLGDSREHLDVDEGFIEWVEARSCSTRRRSLLGGLTGIRSLTTTPIIHPLAITCSLDWIVVLHELMPNLQDQHWPTESDKGVAQARD